MRWEFLSNEPHPGQFENEKIALDEAQRLFDRGLSTSQTLRMAREVVARHQLELLQNREMGLSKDVEITGILHGIEQLPTLKRTSFTQLKRPFRVQI